MKKTTTKKLSLSRETVANLEAGIWSRPWAASSPATTRPARTPRPAQGPPAGAEPFVGLGPMPSGFRAGGLAAPERMESNSDQTGQAEEVQR
jgi:hypothetical protein